MPQTPGRSVSAPNHQRKRHCSNDCVVTHLSSNDWNGDDPYMWNPEARDSSPIIFTFMSSWERTKMPPLPGRRGTRRSLWKRAAAGLDEVSGFSCGAIT